MPSRGYSNMKSTLGLVLLALCAGSAFGKVSTGSIVRPNEQWVLIDSFCFDTEGGVSFSLIPTYACNLK